MVSIRGSLETPVTLIAGIVQVAALSAALLALHNFRDTLGSYVSVGNELLGDVTGYVGVPNPLDFLMSNLFNAVQFVAPQSVQIGLTHEALIELTGSNENAFGVGAGLLLAVPASHWVRHGLKSTVLVPAGFIDMLIRSRRQSKEPGEPEPEQQSWVGGFVDFLRKNGITSGK